MYSASSPPAETGGVGEGHVPVDDGRLVGDQAPPDRVAIALERLHERPVRDRGQQVAAPPAAPRGGPSRTSKASAIPATRRHSVGPPDHDASKLQTSIAPSTIRSRQPLCGELALPGADAPRGRRSRTSRMARRSLCQPQGSSNQCRSSVGDQRDEAQCLLGRPALVRRRPAGRSQVPGARAGPELEPPRRPVRADSPPTLNFMPAKPAAGDRPRPPPRTPTGPVVVAADGDDGDAAAIAAPEPPQGLAGGLAHGIPERGVDAGAGHETHAPVAEDVEGGGPGQLPAALDRQRVLADQPAARPRGG